ncbi:universal stress protein [Methylotenera mobilis]|uniref:UspA domain protein n=1 Tax=Methylotenera mobilis (strain JLW8 / ATCC BAA-1282 / DSM 17540) TaxID=583345 RepID=C6WUM7_METML|nr:universal stress protein [Methylotenera mobilis]ACT47626.1 UspA domain protein [Methylotenera mobilis JLW8]
MQAISHIVVGTDFSAEADLAVQRAALISKALKATLHLIHIVHPLDLYAGSELPFSLQTHYQQAQQETVKTQIDTLAFKLREQFNISAEAVTRVGRAHTEIAHYADSVHAKLVVVGAQGEHTLLEKLIGSTSARLMAVTKCATLIVKNKNPAVPPYRHVVAAVNFSAGAEKVPALTRTIAPDAHVEGLLIFDTNQEAHMYKAGINETLLQQYRDHALAEAERKLSEIFSEQLLGGKVSTTILSGYPSQSICKHALAQQADLIVIGKNEKSGIESWLLGSVSKGVAYTATCDVLLTN